MNRGPHLPAVALGHDTPDTHLCYELAKILVHLLSEKAPTLIDFLRCASPYDAGQSAAQVCLKTDLGKLAGTFLGPGDWAPDPLAIAECWEQPSQGSSAEELIRL